MYLDEKGLRDLWARIGSTFARLGQSGASISVSGSTLYLYAADGSLLDSAQLPGSSGESISEATANARFGTHMDVSGGYLRLLNANNAVIGRVQLTELR